MNPWQKRYATRWALDAIARRDYSAAWWWCGVLHWHARRVSDTLSTIIRGAQ